MTIPTKIGNAKIPTRVTARNNRQLKKLEMHHIKNTAYTIPPIGVEILKKRTNASHVFQTNHPVQNKTQARTSEIGDASVISCSIDLPPLFGALLLGTDQNVQAGLPTISRVQPDAPP